MEQSQPTPSLFPPVDNDRPPYSYKELIIKAFELVKSKPLELRDIYFLISGIFPYYKPGGAWQSAIRHVLLLDPMFSTDPGTNLWRIILNSNSQTSQFQPMQCSPISSVSDYENLIPVSSLLMSNTPASICNKDLAFYKSTEYNRELLPFTHSNSVNTVSSYTSSQPRMSSFESSNRWIDGYPGTSLQEVACMPSTAIYGSNFSDSLRSDQTVSGEFQRDCRFFNDHNSRYLKPVKPNVIRPFLSSNYETLSNYLPLSTYPVNANSSIYLGSRLYEESLIKSNPFINPQNESTFNFPKMQNYSSDYRYSQMRNEEAHSNTLRNCSPQTDFGSPASLNMDIPSNPQNTFPNNISESFCPYRCLNKSESVPSNQISNQLISVNIHASPCLDQTQNNFDLSTESTNDFQHLATYHERKPNIKIANSDKHAVSCLINPINTINGSVYHNPPYFIERNANSQYRDSRCNANMNVDSPSLNSITDFINHMSGLSSSSTISLNTQESAALGNNIKERKTNWENSLINININLSAFENAGRFNIAKIGDIPTSETQLSTSNISPKPAVQEDIGTQEISKNDDSLHSTAEQKCSGYHKININEMKSVAETALSESSDVNTSVTKLIINEAGTDYGCSGTASEDTGNFSIKRNKSGMDFSTFENTDENIEPTDCISIDTDTDYVNVKSKSTDKNGVKSDQFSSISETLIVHTAGSCDKPLESNVDALSDCLDTQNSKSDSKTDITNESLLTPEINFSEEHDNVSTDCITDSSNADDCNDCLESQNLKSGARIDVTAESLLTPEINLAEGHNSVSTDVCIPVLSNVYKSNDSLERQNLKSGLGIDIATELLLTPKMILFEGNDSLSTDSIRVSKNDDSNKFLETEDSKTGHKLGVETGSLLSHEINLPKENDPVSTDCIPVPSNFDDSNDCLEIHDPKFGHKSNVETESLLSCEINLPKETKSVSIHGIPVSSNVDDSRVCLETRDPKSRHKLDVESESLLSLEINVPEEKNSVSTDVIPVSSNVDDSDDCLETQNPKSGHKLDVETESLLSREINLPKENNSVSIDGIPVSSNVVNSNDCLETQDPRGHKLDVETEPLLSLEINVPEEKNSVSTDAIPVSSNVVNSNDCFETQDPRGHKLDVETEPLLSLEINSPKENNSVSIDGIPVSSNVVDSNVCLETNDIKSRHKLDVETEPLLSREINSPKENNSESVDDIPVTSNVDNSNDCLETHYPKSGHILDKETESLLSHKINLPKKNHSVSTDGIPFSSNVDDSNDCLKTQNPKSGHKLDEETESLLSLEMNLFKENNSVSTSGNSFPSNVDDSSDCLETLNPKSGLRISVKSDSLLSREVNLSKEHDSEPTVSIPVSSNDDKFINSLEKSHSKYDPSIDVVTELLLPPGDPSIDVVTELLLPPGSDQQGSVSTCCIPVTPTIVVNTNLNKQYASSAAKDSNSNKDLKLKSHSSSCLENEIKQCYVVLERINGPVKNLNSNSKATEESVIKNFASNMTSHSERESQDYQANTLTSSLSGNNQPLVSKGVASRESICPVPAPEFLGAALDAEIETITNVKKTRSSLPQKIKGYLKPSYNYCRLITQALATMPERKATALQICDIISKKHPYYYHLTSFFNWKGSIYSALRTRKKFFTMVDITDDKKEYIWSFNPTFEQYMLDKWVPKYVKTKTSSSSIQNYIPMLPKIHPQQVTPSTSSQCSMVLTPTSTSLTTVSSDSPSPVIVLSGTLVTPTTAFDSDSCCSADVYPITSGSSERDPLEPEDSLLDPIMEIQCGSNDVKPWEPEVTVSESTPNSLSKEHKIAPASVALQEHTPNSLSKERKLAPALTSYTIGKQGSVVSTSKLNRDFSLDNLHYRHVILQDEILYRVNFNKEHEKIEKFRLHCTVCDTHLGTSGSTCRYRVRLHATLGVLVCNRCYAATCNPSYLTCQWCARGEDVMVSRSIMVSCSSCVFRFCQICIERNFGETWCTTTMQRKDWKCFRCDTKQIWPHRAIAYFLFRHYRHIKKQKDGMKDFMASSPTEKRFYIQDLSTCCKSKAYRGQSSATVAVPCSDAPVVSRASVLVPPIAPKPALVTTSATPPPLCAVSSQQPMFVIGEQSPSYIYVQTPRSVPSVTLNTGTQYIHNVYPDKNYVVMESTVGPSVNPILPNNILYPQSSAPSPSFPVVIPQQTSEMDVSIVSEHRPPSPYTSPKNSASSSYPAINVEVTPIQDSSNENYKKTLSNTVIKTNSDLVASKTRQNNPLDISVTLASKTLAPEAEEPIIIPDADTPEELKIQEEKVVALPLLSARERIERRPMPKSRKQSLLRTVLMNESIESMKRHLHLQSDDNISTNKNEIITMSGPPKLSNEGGQNIEEPILKSIIETATERLLNLQRNQTCSSSAGNKAETRPGGTDSYIDLCENEIPSPQLESEVVDPPIIIPKIKIKTLKELQDPQIFNDNHIIHEHQELKNDGDINKESDNTGQQCINENEEPNNQNLVDNPEINIAGLKQGIIEASRTLINTQKKFKELAKIISSNLSYKPDQAVDLIKQFHDILKTCHKELDQIDNNVKHQFGHLIPSTDINLILQTMKNKEETNPNAGPVILKKKRKWRKSRMHDKKKPCTKKSQKNTEQFKDTNIENVESNQTDNITINAESLKRKRDLLDFNPLGKKIILGSPEITEEDLRQIPNSWDSSTQKVLYQNNYSASHNQVFMEELKRRQYLARKEAWKKKNIWLTFRRKKKRKYTKRSLECNTNGRLVYNEDGSLAKKRPYKRRKKKYDSDDEDDKTYKPKNTYPYPVGLRKRRSSELSRPLRLSARMHPSTVAHVAQLTSSEQKDVTHLIKPCYVVLDRLDPKMVELLERRIVEEDERSEVSLSDSEVRSLDNLSGCEEISVENLNDYNETN